MPESRRFVLTFAPYRRTCGPHEPFGRLRHRERIGDRAPEKLEGRLGARVKRGPPKLVGARVDDAGPVGQPLLQVSRHIRREPRVNRFLLGEARLNRPVIRRVEVKFDLMTAAKDVVGLRRRDCVHLIRIARRNAHHAFEFGVELSRGERLPTRGGRLRDPRGRLLLQAEIRTQIVDAPDDARKASRGAAARIQLPRFVLVHPQHKLPVEQVE